MSNNSNSNKDDFKKDKHEFESDANKQTIEEFPEFGNFNNIKSMKTFLTTFKQKNPTFSIQTQTPEEILKLYNLYISKDYLQNEDKYKSILFNDDETANDESKRETNKNLSLYFSTEKSKIKMSHQANARELIFSFFESIKSPFLSTNAISLMTINGSDCEFLSDFDEDKKQENIYRTLFNKFLEIDGSLEVFVDHYCTIINQFEAGSNKDFIESRILQFKGVTAIMVKYPSLISRLGKIMKKFGPILFQLLSQSDLSTKIESFRCIVNIFTSGVIKKKTKLKWLSKLIAVCSTDSVLFSLLINFFVTNQSITDKIIDLSVLADRIIERSVLFYNKNHKLSQRDDLFPYEEAFNGVCSIETLKAIELILVTISKSNKKSRKSKKVPQEINDDDNEEASLDLDEDQYEASNEFEYNVNDLTQSFSFLFNVAIEDRIFGRAAIETIRNILVSFIMPESDSQNPKKYFEKENIPLLKWIAFLIRKSIIMFYIAEKSSNFQIFERRCKVVENLCLRLCSDDITVSPFLTSVTLNILRAVLCCKKPPETKKEKVKFASISHFAKSFGIEAESINGDSENIDVLTKEFLKSPTSELIEEEELIKFVHYPFDEEIDRNLMEN